MNVPGLKSVLCAIIFPPLFLENRIFRKYVERKAKVTKIALEIL